MDFTAELLTRLQKGDSVEDLASELTKAINEANTQNERLKAEAKGKRKTEKKVAAIDALLDAIEQIITAWDLGDHLLDAVDEIEAEDLVQEIDKAVPAVQAYGQLLNELVQLREARPVSDAPTQVKKLDPIEDFLNKCVR